MTNRELMAISDTDVFVVTGSQSEAVFDQDWENHWVAGVFTSREAAEIFAVEEVKRIRDSQQGQTGWGTPSFEISDPIQLNKGIQR